MAGLAQQHLANYNVSMGEAREFIMTNMEDLSTVRDVCLEFGVTNDMIAEVLASDFPGLGGTDVANHFAINGIEANVLGGSSRTIDITRPVNELSVDGLNFALIAPSNFSAEYWTVDGRQLLEKWEDYGYGTDVTLPKYTIDGRDLIVEATTYDETTVFTFPDYDISVGDVGHARGYAADGTLLGEGHFEVMSVSEHGGIIPNLLDQSNSLSIYNGVYAGQFTGDQSGDIETTIEDGDVWGWWYSYEFNEFGDLFGSVDTSGNLTMSAVDEDGVPISFAGVVANESIDGSWTMPGYGAGAMHLDFAYGF